MAFPGGTRLRPYEIVSELGGGGTGEWQGLGESRQRHLSQGWTLVREDQEWQIMTEAEAKAAGYKESQKD